MISLPKLDPKNKKILVVGPGGSFLCPPIIKALQTLGYECLFFNYRKGFVYQNNFTKKVIRNIPLARFLKDMTIRSINIKLLNLVKKYRPGLVLMSDAENITPETVSAIKKTGAVTANWFTDFISHWEIIKKISPVYDYFFSPDPLVLKKLAELGLTNCFYLPFAVEATPNSTDFEDDIRIYDISFVGSYNPNTWKQREALLSAVADLGLNIWGPKTWLKTSLKNNYRGEVSGQEMKDIYLQSKIAIDIPWDNYPADGISMRPTEVMATGACLFMYDIRSDMARLFKKNEEYVSFLNQQSLQEKIKYFLDHQDERKNIALAGYQETLKNHTHEIRMKQMLEMMGLAI